jgi:predicted fused transcriptional regulator/phosphomethylpyrimidine kinase
VIQPGSKVSVPESVEVPDDLLRQAKAVWALSKIASRDAKIEVGGLLKRHLLERLKQVERLSEKQRRVRRANREWIIRHAAANVGMPVNRVYDLIRLAATVELLADGGQVGQLSYSSLRLFRVLVRRPVGELKRSSNGPGMTPVEKEQWEVVPPIQKSRAIFAMAVAGGYDEAGVRIILPRRAAGRVEERSAPKPAPIQAARLGSPRDVAEMILDMIRGNEDADAVMRILETELRQLRVLK